MRVKLARTAGFCFGVRRAVEKALEAANRREGKILTLGPLIHNPQVLALLAERGVEAVASVDRVAGDQTVIIRAHGVPPETREQLEAKAGRVINATCPRVVRVQKLIKRHTDQGHQAIIVGDADHAEVQGLYGCAPEGRAVVINSAAEVGELPDYGSVLLAAQTTQNEKVFEEIAAAVQARWPEAVIHNTICNATHRRQAEAVNLARQADCVIVVGGSFSANTQRLVEVAVQAGAEAWAVETEDELDLDRLKNYRTIGVTAGASTPNWLIRKIVEAIRSVQGKGESPAKVFFFRLFRFLLKSNLLTAAGGAGLALISGLAQQLPLSLSLIAAPFCYLYAMHVLNHYTDKKAAVYNDPDLIRFMNKHRFFLIGSSILAAGLGLVMAASLGLAQFIILTGLSGLGLVYSIRLVPRNWQRWFSYSTLRDLPGSKPLVISLAWGVICGVWPDLAFGPSAGPGLVMGLLITLIAFIRAALYDILDLQGDLAVGKETLPILLGEKKSISLLKHLSLISICLVFIAPLTGLVTPAVWLLVFPAVGPGLIVSAYQRRRLFPGLFMEGAIESGFLVAGILALLFI